MMSNAFQYRKIFWVLILCLLGGGTIWAIFCLSIEPDKITEEVRPYEIRQKDFVAGVYQYEDIKSPYRLRMIKAPKGMTMYRHTLYGNHRTYRISWMPDKLSEGNSYEVILDVGDGSGDTQSKFTVSVATSRSIKMKVSQRYSSTIIDDKGCDLSALEGEHFRLNFGESNYTTMNKADIDMNKIDIAMLTSSVDYHVPAHIQRLSCFFRIGKGELMDVFHPMGDYFMLSLNPYKTENQSVLSHFYKVTELTAFHKRKLFNQRKEQLHLYRYVTDPTAYITSVEVISDDSLVWEQAVDSLFHYPHAHGLYFIGVDTTEQ